MKTNKITSQPPVYNHEGGKASRQTPLAELERTVTNCLLFENTFYESGNDIADRIRILVGQCKPQDVAGLAQYTRDKLGLRHVSLYLAASLAYTRPRVPNLVANTVDNVIKRADELAEFLSLYWLVNGTKGSTKKAPLSAQVKKGLALAFTKFDEYQLGKYNRDADIKMRDVLFLCHAKPASPEQDALWKKLVNNTLAIPDTWETQLSGGADKKETFTRLIAEGKLGQLALIRNLRNMHEAGVSRTVVKEALASAKTWGILPYQFLSAMGAAPTYESDLEDLMLRNVRDLPKLQGRTVLLVDVSPSMEGALSSRSQMTRIGAACGLAIQLREQCEDVRIFPFSSVCLEIPQRRGNALAEAIYKAVPHDGTLISNALSVVHRACGRVDRVVMVTDEQSQDGIIPPTATHGYLINVAAYKPGLSTHGGWQRINGFSERVVEWIQATESHAE